ncbi:tetratricopeptide repeat protein [Sorangium sp. So ce118]
MAAIDGFRRALTLDPDEPRADALLAVALLRRKRLGAALIEAQTARRLSPEAPLTHRVLGRVLLAPPRPSEARERVATARGLAPSAPRPSAASPPSRGTLIATIAPSSS